MKIMKKIKLDYFNKYNFDVSDDAKQRNEHSKETQLACVFYIF